VKTHGTASPVVATGGPQRHIMVQAPAGVGMPGAAVWGPWAVAWTGAGPEGELLSAADGGSDRGASPAARARENFFQLVAAGGWRRGAGLGGSGRVGVGGRGVVGGGAGRGVEARRAVQVFRGPGVVAGRTGGGDGGGESRGVGGEARGTVAPVSEVHDAGGESR